MQVQLTPSLASGILYGEGAQSENIAKLNGIAAVLDVNKIAIEDRAEILGHKYENGILIEKAGDEAPFLAVGFEVEGTNKCNELVWLLKGRAQRLTEPCSSRQTVSTFQQTALRLISFRVILTEN